MSTGYEHPNVVDITAGAGVTVTGGDSHPVVGLAGGVTSVGVVGVNKTSATMHPDAAHGVAGAPVTMSPTAPATRLGSDCFAGVNGAQGGVSGWTVAGTAMETVTLDMVVTYSDATTQTFLNYTATTADGFLPLVTPPPGLVEDGKAIASVAFSISSSIDNSAATATVDLVGSAQ